MNKGIIWRVSNGRITRYIRATTLDEASQKFSEANHSDAVEFQPVDEEIIHAVYFTDAPGDPAYFRGSKASAQAAANQYIRQWHLNASIDRIEAV